MMEIIRSKVLNIFQEIMVHVYGLIVTSVACICVSQSLLAELLSAKTHTQVEGLEALDANLLPEQRSTTGPSLMREG